LKTTIKKQGRVTMKRLGRLTLVVGFGVVVPTAFTAAGQTTPPAARAAQARPPAAASQLPRASDGKPDFSGIWQSINTATWDIQDHSSSLGVPPGLGVVDGNELPYRPEALEQKKQNFAKRATDDPALAKCLLPGVPRATYMPYPFEIIQNPNMIGLRYAFARAVRTIRLDGKSRDWLEGWPDFWMGDSRGKWEGDTLVVDVRKLDEHTWFDHAGNFHSDALHVVERYSPIDRDHIQYEATIEDPDVFTRPWKMSMPLYRIIDKNFEVFEWDCRFDQDSQKYKDAIPK
jgi:hypothetical protein